MSTPYLVALFSCSDKSLPLRPGAPSLITFFPPRRVLARPLATVSRVYGSPCLASPLLTAMPASCRPCSLPRVLPVAPDASRSNASSFAAVATQSRQQARRRRRSWPWQAQHTQPPHPCVPTSEGSISSMSVLLCITVPAILRVSWDTGMLTMLSLSFRVSPCWVVHGCR